jgi:hypothetical protein
MSVRLVLIFKEADRATAELPHRAFHRVVCHGLLAIYLALLPDVLAPPATQKRLIGRISATRY